MTYLILGRDNKQYGPVDLSTLGEWLRRGLVSGASYSWTMGESHWRPLRARPEVIERFGSVLTSDTASSAADTTLLPQRSTSTVGEPPQGIDGPSATSSPVVQSPRVAKAGAMTNNFSLAGGALAFFALFPGSTSVMLCTLELVLCYRIGKLYLGQDYSLAEEITAYVWVFLAALVGQFVASILLEALTFLPIIGWAIKGGVAAGIIKALGSLLTEHYEKVTR